MNTPNQVRCPRCHAPFVCNAGAIQACGCRQIELTSEEAQYIRGVAVQTNEVNCFCTSCLQDLKAEYHRQPQMTNYNV